MKKIKTNQNIGKISSFILTGILFIGILIGTIFGLKSAIQNKGEIDKNYNQKVTLQTSVEIKNSDKNINDAASSLFQTLKYLGFENSEIKSFGNETLQITIPISSFVKDGKPSTDEIYKTSSNIQYVNEIEVLEVSLFFNGILDFRTTDGVPIFIKDEKGQTIFNEDGVKPVDPPNKVNFNDSEPLIEMFGSASLKHSSGSPFIRLNFKDASPSIITEYEIAFDDWASYVEGGQSLDYAVWFDYDKLETIAKKIDSEYDPETGLYNSYISDGITGNEVWIKPFFVTEGTDAPKSKFESFVNLRNGQGSSWINEKSGTYFVNKINNSGNYKFSNIKVSLNLKHSKGIILIVMFAVFILLIVVLIFLFSWYFGLLGFVASSLIMLIGLFSVLIYSSIGLVITGFGISSLIISLLIISLITFVILSIYKKNKDKSTSEVEKFKTNFRDANSMLFLPLTIFTLGLFLSGTLLSPIITVSIYLIVLFAIIGYLIMIIILFPLILLIDLFINFSIEENVGKWNISTGVNKFKDKNDTSLDEENSKTLSNSSLSFSIAGIISIVLSLFVGGLLFTFFGTPVNVAGKTNTNYRYQIELIEKPINSIINDPNDTKTISFLEESYNNDVEKIGDVKKVFNSNGVKVRSIDVDRMDEIRLNDKDKGPDIKLEATYGYTVYSNKSIDSKKLKNINEGLSNIKVKTTDNYDAKESGFILSETSSSLTNFNGKKAMKSINYSQNKETINSIYAVLILILFSTITFLLLFGWGVGSTYLITSVAELSLITFPIFVLFLPYNIIVWFSIITSVLLSSVMKSYVSRSVRKSDLSDKVWFKHSRKVIPIIIVWLSIFLGIEILLAFAYGFIFLLSSFVITIWSMVILSFSQYFVFPFYSRKLDGYRKKLKDNKKNDDVTRSKNKDIISEEYIKGINM